MKPKRDDEDGMEKLKQNDTGEADDCGCATVTLLNVGACLAGFLFGYDTGIVSGAVANVQGTLGLSTSQIELAVAATPAGACVFSLLAAYFNDRLGRRGTLVVASGFYAAGAFVVGAATDFPTLVVGRTGLGIAVGLGSMTVPIFVAEIAPAQHRGGMVTLYDMMIVVGQVIAGLVNGLALYADRGAWRFTMGFAALPAVVQGFLLVGLPESPRWLLQAGRRDDAWDALKRVRTRVGPHAIIESSVADELAEIEALVKQEDELRQQEIAAVSEGSAWRNSPWVAVFRTPARRRALLVGVAIMAIQALSGINAIMYYGASIASSVGLSHKQSVWTAAVFDVAQLLGVVASITRMDVDGRRTLALRSTSLVCLALAVIVVCSPPSPGKSAAGVLIACIIYLFVFGSGLSGVAWTLNSEIHPLVTRSHAQSIAVATNWGCNFAISAVFLSISATFGPAIAFSIFLLASLFGFTWLFFFLPETKGVSLEQLERLFAQPLSRKAAILAPTLARDDDDEERKTPSHAEVELV